MNVKSQSNWLNKDIEYLKNVNITEYDLASGGLSVIKEYELLPKDKIAKLDAMDKQTKNITIGKLQIKLKNLSKNMVIGFGLARQLFVDTNQIPDDNILAIKKDALFLINCEGIDGNLTDNLTFRPKNTYSSYMYINRKEFYFSSSTREMDIKGFSEDVKSAQKDYLFADFARFMLISEKGNYDQLISQLTEYQIKYLDKKLPLETYRNIDTGLFTYTLNGFDSEFVDESFIDDLDISYNYINYVLPMIQLLLKK